MKNKNVSAAWFSILCLSLLLGACSVPFMPTSSAPTEIWTLTWQSNGQTYTTPQEAFRAQAKVVNTSRQYQTPVSTKWLLVDKANAIVLTQDDATDKSYSIGYMQSVPGQGWEGIQSMGIQRPAAGSGIDLKRTYPWLPAGEYLSGATNLGINATGGEAQLWLDGKSGVFFVAHVLSMQGQPTLEPGSSDVSINGNPGWLTQQKNFTQIIEEKTGDALIFGGTSSVQQSKQIVSTLNRANGM